jgi:hypothetical protein
LGGHVGEYVFVGYLVEVVRAAIPTVSTKDTGAVIQVLLFVDEVGVVRVNPCTRLYVEVERVPK